MAINFPSSPTASQTYTFNGIVWTYNGYAWVSTSGSGGGGSGTQGETGPQGLTGPQGSGGGSTGSQGNTGPQGSQGLTGPQGQNGQSSQFFNYLGSTSSTSGDPSAGYLIWNNLTQISSTQINVSHLDELGNDVDIFLALISSGDKMIIQDRNDSNSYQQWLVNGSPTIIPNSYVEIPVGLITATGTGYTNFPNGHELILVLSAVGATGPQGLQGNTGPQGSTGIQGVTGTQGPTGPEGLTGPSGITGSQGPTGPSGESIVVSLTDASLISTDASLGNVFYVTLGGNRTLSNPTNVTSGKRIIWRIKQDATGGRTISLDTKFRLGTDITSVVLSTSPNVTDYIGAIYNAQDDKWDVIAFVKGFA